MLQRIAARILTRREKGQSLVEVAIAFPIFLIILAGVVEVSHLGITQNRVSNAARASTRFASQGGENEGIPIVALNSVTQTLELGVDVWDMWAVRGTLDNNGNCCVDNTWEFTHVYGISQTEAFSDVNELAIRQQVEEELQLDDAAGAADLRFVGTYVIHDIKSILGIQAIPSLLGYNSVKGLNVMRLYGTDYDEAGGCTGFPIAVEEGIRSVNPPGANTGNDYPNTNDFHPTSPKPSYAQFQNFNVPNVALEDAQEGYIYKVQNGSGSGAFGWLVWNNRINASANTLANSLTYPGDSRDYSDVGNCSANTCPTPLYTHMVLGYVNPLDTSDLGMNIGDWVTVNTGSVNSDGVRTVVNDHIAKGRYLRLIVWGYDNNSNPTSPHGTGSNQYFRLKGFAVFRLLGHKLSQGGGSASWILAEFIKWDTSCGQSQS
jgi:hypothetical protein